MATATIDRTRRDSITVSYEHPLIVRIAHWLNAVALVVLIMSGLRSTVAGDDAALYNSLLLTVKDAATLRNVERGDRA